MTVPITPEQQRAAKALREALGFIKQGDLHAAAGVLLGAAIMADDLAVGQRLIECASAALRGRGR